MSPPYPRSFVVIVDGVCVANVVGVAHVAGVVDLVAAADVAGGHVVARVGGGDGAVRGALASQESQGEQAEVWLVPQVEETQVGAAGAAGVGAVGLRRALPLQGRLLVAVHAAAQQLLVLRRRVVLTAHAGGRHRRTALVKGSPSVYIETTRCGQSAEDVCDCVSVGTVGMCGLRLKRATDSLPINDGTKQRLEILVLTRPHVSRFSLKRFSQTICYQALSVAFNVLLIFFSFFFPKAPC